MTAELLTSLCLFAFVTSITPGPNNAMLFASGVNHGIRRTLPHLLGVTLGFTLMQLAVGLGIGVLFEAVPGLYPTLRGIGLAYMLYLAWRIGNSTPPKTAPQPNQAAQAMPGTTPQSGRPMTFLEASAFQWVNPKALMMCITAASTYSPPDSPILGAFIVTGVFFVAGMPCVALWVLLGRLMRGLLQSRKRLLAFNWAMALLLVASMAPMAHEVLRDGLF